MVEAVADVDVGVGAKERFDDVVVVVLTCLQQRRLAIVAAGIDPGTGGEQLAAAQKERASHICVDCGYIYTLPVAFEEQPKSYICPQCNAPKSRFAPYDVETGRAKGGGLSTPLITVASTVAGLAGMAYFLKDVL